MTTTREILTLSTGPTEVLWRRSARARKVSLRIDPQVGGVIVTLPARGGRVSVKAAGLALLRDNAAWVAERLSRLPAMTTLSDGAILPLEGRPHRISHRPDTRGGTRIEAGEIIVTGAPEFLTRRVGDFLRAEARRRLSALALAKAVAAGVTPRRVVVKDTRSRWGSCTVDGTLMFSWRLVMAPPHVQDYIAAHEVAHLRHMNHGTSFWALVAQLTDHRAHAVQWLGEHGPGLLRLCPKP